MKKIIFISAVFFMMFAQFSLAMGNSQNQDTSVNNAAVDQAKADYRVLLQEMKKMGQQYSQITGEAKKIIKEEGVPVWNEQKQTFEISHDLNFTDSGPIKETDKEIKVILDLPGVKKESLKVSVQDDQVLRITGMRRVENEETPVDQRMELPARVNGRNPKAKYEDGVLTVTLQKAELPKKEISVPVQ